MIYTPLTKKAIQIAYAAHHGQLDKGGMPYICHPLHLAESMEDEISCCAALLHDVAEDTEITLDDLAAEFPAEVLEVLKLLTHEKGTDYFDYVRNIRQNPIAVKVKLADLAHNSNQSRITGSGMDEATKSYFRNKYSRAKAILLEE